MARYIATMSRPDLRGPPPYNPYRFTTEMLIPSYGRGLNCVAMALPKQLIDIEKIYLEPAVEDYARGREVLARYPDAERIPVDSHWKIPSLHGNEGSAEDWLKIKRNVLVLGVKKSLSMRPNGRSAHFIAPSTSNGCAMACA